MSAERHIPHSRPLIGDEEIRAAERVLRSGHLSQGPEVEAFEQECAAFLGRRHAVALNSGTAALHLAIQSLNPSGEAHVGIPSYACAALLTAVTHAGAIAALGDIDPDYNLDPKTLPVSCDTAIVTHLFGCPGSLPENGTVVEDLAQALGGPCGRRGDIAIASFYATKLMTSGGEGGMLLCDDPDLAEYARERRDYDNRDTFELRYNYKMTDLAAAIGREQLKKLPSWIEGRREIASEYTQAFQGLPLGLPDGEDHIFFRYVVSTEERVSLETHLNQRGIEAKRPVYLPAHQYFTKETGVRAKLLEAYPASELAHDTALSIPLNSAMLAADIQYVVKSIRQFF